MCKSLNTIVVISNSNIYWSVATVNIRKINVTRTTSYNVVAWNNHNTSYSSNYITASNSHTTAVNTDNSSENNANRNKNSAKTARTENLTIDNVIDADRNATADENKSDYVNAADDTIWTYTNSTGTIENSCRIPWQQVLWITDVGPLLMIWTWIAALAGIIVHKITQLRVEAGTLMQTIM